MVKRTQKKGVRATQGLRCNYRAGRRPPAPFAASAFVRLRLPASNLRPSFGLVNRHTLATPPIRQLIENKRGEEF
jgi:hypothetical protein